MRGALKKLILWALADESPQVQRDERTYAERTWRFTRLLSLVSFALSLLAIVCAAFLFVAIWVVNNEFVSGETGSELGPEFDTISAAAAVGRLDLVSMALTFIGLVAAFSVIYGWTAFRSVAMDAAKSETKARVPEELRELMDADGDRLVGLALQDAELLARIQQGFTAIGLDDTDATDSDNIDTDPGFVDPTFRQKEEG